jgi:hypothetical protein
VETETGVGPGRWAVSTLPRRLLIVWTRLGFSTLSGKK